MLGVTWQRDCRGKYPVTRGYQRGLGSAACLFCCRCCCFFSETATVTSATDLLMVRKDDLVDILHQWPEVMAELTDEAERHFRAIKVREALSTAGKYIRRATYEYEAVLLLLRLFRWSPGEPEEASALSTLTFLPERMFKFSVYQFEPDCPVHIYIFD